MHSISGNLKSLSRRLTYCTTTGRHLLHSLHDLRGCTQAIEKLITDAAEEDKQCWAGQLEKDGAFQLANGATQYTISSAMVSFKPEERKVSGRCEKSPREFVSSVVVVLPRHQR